MRVLWVLSALAVLPAAYWLVLVFEQQAAPAQGAAAAIAVAIAVIPYCFVRSLAEATRSDELSKISQQVETHTKLLASIANDTAEKEKAAGAD